MTPIFSKRRKERLSQFSFVLGTKGGGEDGGGSGGFKDFPYYQIETKVLFTSIAISGIKILSQGRRHILPTCLISIPFNVLRLTPSFVILVCSK